jgi:uncharacterized damage-inducible protein DinB
MSERERLVDLLRRVHDGDAWHGPSVMAALEGVDAAAARARPVAGAHSIWELALHIVAWRHEVEQRLAGKVPGLPAEGDWPPVPDVDEGWGGTAGLLEASHESIVSAVHALGDDAFDREVGDERQPGLGARVTNAVMLHGLVHHDAYHAGQITILKKGLGL